MKRYLMSWSLTMMWWWRKKLTECLNLTMTTRSYYLMLRKRRK